MYYSIPNDIEQKAIELFSSLLPDYLMKARSIYNIDLEECLEKCNHIDNTPLFGNKENYFKHENAFLLMPILRKRISVAIDIEFEDDYLSNYSWGVDFDVSDRDILVFSGAYMISMFGQDLFEIDYKKWGFSTFEDMVFYGGAVIANIHYRSYNDQEFQWRSVLDDSKEVVNCFSHYVHGDLRFIQRDVSVNLVKSPFGDLIRIGKCTSKVLSAYHSTECQLLVTLLRYAIENGIKPKAYHNYPEYLEKLLETGVAYGNYADAGCKSWFSEVHLLNDPLSGISRGDSVYFTHDLPKEGAGFEKPRLLDGNLVFHPSGVTIMPSDIDNMIHALHLYCKNGACRTSVGNLISLYDHIPHENKLKFTDNPVVIIENVEYK